MKELTHTCHYRLYAYDELCDTDRQLVDAAKEATQGSYAPYSRFQVVVLEVERRYDTKIRLLLYGTEGTYVIEGGISELLPLTFDASFLK